MKVLIVYHAGAMETPRQIYRLLVEDGKIELTVIVPQRLKADRVYDSTGWLCVEREENCEGYRLIPIPLRNPSNYGEGFDNLALRQLIKQIHPDIIHVLDEPFSGYLFQIVWQRLITSPRSKVLFYGFENLPIRIPKYLYPFWRLTWFQMAGGAAANSEALENLKKVGFPNNRPLERIFWGIATDVFKPMDRLVLKKELGLDCEHIVGFVGRLVPEKGLTVLLAAMRRLPTAVHYLFIGSGPMRAELELLSGLPDLSGRVHFYDVMGPEMLVKYMNCMDVMALPSLTTSHWKEQYGRVIGEAMSCGIPVVGSDSGAIPEVIGPAGLIVPEGDVSALAESLHTAIFDRATRENLREEGFRRVEHDLSTRVMAQRLLSFYNRILRA